MKNGDLVTIDMPHGRFEYRVRNWVIVPADDLSRLRSHGHEVLALQACHPRFSASHRYIVYAVPATSAAARHVAGTGVAATPS